MNPPLIVGITSLPKRVGLIRPALESLLAGDTTPDAIRLVLPEKPLRGTDVYEVPAFLNDPAFHRGIVEVVRVERDFGPGTKLLGALPTIAEPSVLVIADDDVRYRRDFLTGLYEAQCADRSTSFSYEAVPLGGITKGQGVDGFSFWTPNLAGIDQFVAAYIDGTDLVFHDDLWISFFLATRDVSVKHLHHLLKGKLIYEQIHVVDALMHMEGDLDRLRLDRWGIRTLTRRVAMPPARRRAMMALALRRSCMSAPRRGAIATRKSLGRLVRRVLGQAILRR